MSSSEPIHAARAGGREFRYLESGEGPPVVLWHGFPDLPHTWDRTRAALVDAGYRTIAPYLRGYHPETIVSGVGYAADDLAVDGLMLLDALELDRAVVIGHDWGAGITYGVAELAPERLRGIVAIDIPHPATVRPNPRLAWLARHFLGLKLPWADQKMRRNDFAHVDRLYRRWSPTWSGPERDAAVRHVVEAFRDPAVLHAALDYYRALAPSRGGPPQIDVPALLVVGGAVPTTVRAFDRVGDAFAPSNEPTVEIIDGAGHWAHRENERQFHDALLPWLARIHAR